MAGRQAITGMEGAAVRLRSAGVLATVDRGLAVGPGLGEGGGGGDLVHRLLPRGWG